MSDSSPDPREVDQYAAAVLDGWPLTELPPSYHYNIVSRLREMQSTALSAHELPRAQLIANKLHSLSSIHSEQSFATDASAQLQRAETKLARSKTAFDRAKDTHERVVAQFQADAEAALAHLDARHLADLEKFDRDHDRDPPESFTKFSREYLQLRAIESFMVSSKRYTEADAVRGKADVMEQQERDVQRQNWRDHTEKQRELLIARQATARRCLIEKWEKEWAAIIASRRKDEGRFQKAVQASGVAAELAAERGEVPEQPEQSGLPPLCRAPRGKALVIRWKNYVRNDTALLMNRHTKGRR
jgi:hypothetical protein